MNLYFILNGKYNKDVLLSFKKYILPPGLLRLIKIIVIFAGIMTIFCLATKDMLFTSLYVFGIFFICIEIKMVRNYLIKKISRIMLKKYQELPFILKFYNDYFTLSNVFDTDSIDINYSRIKRIVETREYLFVISKENMCFPISNDININEKYAWLDFMLEKNKKIKLQNVK